MRSVGDKPLDLGVQDTRDLDYLRTALSTWLTQALDTRTDGPSDTDLLALRDWIDGGCDGDLPEYQGREHAGDAPLAQQTAMSMRVFMETKDWSPARLRKALVAARLGQR